MHRTLNQDFFKTWSPEMAYVLGFFAADGSMLKNSRGAHFIEFTITDRIVLEQIQLATQSSHRIARRERGGSAKTAYRLQIGSKQWFDDLAKFGFTQHKSNTLTFPKVPEKYLGDFVRGYFDGDGCVYFKEHLSKWHKRNVWVFTSRFTSGSVLFLTVLHDRLRKRGISGGHINNKKADSISCSVDATVLRSIG